MSEENFFEECFDDLFDQAQKIVEKRGLNMKNIVFIVTHLMQVVEKMEGLSGPDKKELVIDVIDKIIEISDLDDELKSSLQTFIDSTLPSTIEVIVSASKNQLNLNKVVKRGSKILDAMKCKCLSK